MPAPTPKAPMSREWIWHPDLPLEPATVFGWPVRPVNLWRWFAGTWLSFTDTVIWCALAFAVWRFALPGPAAMASLDAASLASIYGRNLVLMVLVAGGLHLYLYTWARQGSDRKYDRAGLASGNRKFTFGNQTLDNVLWTLVSGVTVWTAYEVVYFWGAAKAWFPSFQWSDGPVLFVVIFLLTPAWLAMHFYWVHRFLHWKPFYKRVHALHHRNISIGPWSGISMHPVEHVLYFSSLAIHFVLPSHPAHVLFHIFIQALNPALAHSGFDGIMIGGRNRFQLGNFFHQLHHKYFNCNYGNPEMPWDVWFGTFHDGTAEATARIRKRSQTADRQAAGAV